MKSKKYLRGTIVTAAALCCILMFNSYIFSSVLAASPDKSKVKKVAAANVETKKSTETKKTTETKISDTKPDINAISVEEAKKNALKGIEQFLYKDDFKSWHCTAKYIEGVAPANSPLWVFVFENHVETDYLSPKGKLIDHVNQMSFMVIEVNALTGEYVNSKVYSAGPDFTTGMVLKDMYGIEE